MPNLRIRPAGFILVTLVTSLAGIALVTDLSRVDDWLLAALDRGVRPEWVATVEAVANFKTLPVLFGIWVFLFAIAVLRRRWLPALALMVVPLLAFIGRGVRDAVLVRGWRGAPGEVIADLDEAVAAPAGHLTGAILLYGFVILYATAIRQRWLRWSVRASCALLLAALGFIRMARGTQQPTEVLLAYLLGGLLLVALVAVYRRIDAAAGHLPFALSGVIPHDEREQHVHAATSIVLFDADTVAKVYNPGFVPRAAYWLAFQAPFAYEYNRDALEASVQRRNLARMLTEYWFGAPRVARALGVAQHHGRLALVSERVEGSKPRDPAAARRFLLDLKQRFDDAGLPTWQIDTRQPSALENALEREDGSHVVIDLESGMVFPLASWRSWGRALRRGHLPMFDSVYFDVTREYVECHADAMRARFGETWLAELRETIDAGERAALAWYAAEPRLWGKLIDVRGWKPRMQARLEDGREKAMAFAQDAIGTWEREGRLTRNEADELRDELQRPGVQSVAPHLGAHIVITVFLRFPFGSLARCLWTLWAMILATLRLIARRSSIATWRTEFGIHNPLIALLALIPSAGAFAYLASKPMIENRLLLRVTLDAVLLKIPVKLYERSRLRAVILMEREAGSRGEAPSPMTRSGRARAQGASHVADSQSAAEVQVSTATVRRETLT
jgi:hypothetical protein